MTRDEVMAMTDEELDFTAMRCLSIATQMVCGGKCPKPYSTDIAAAWELVERFLEQRGSGVELHREMDCKEWCCVFSLWEESPRSMGMKDVGWFQTEDAKLSRAITRAFILAMEAK